MRGAVCLDFIAEPREGAAEALSGAISRCVRAVAGGRGLARRDVDTLNSFAADEPPTPVLRYDGTLARAAVDPERSALAAVARNAIEIVATRGGDLRTCAAPACEAAFLDSSRGKRRRWCSMARCGNALKVAAFRRRRQR